MSDKRRGAREWKLTNGLISWSHGTTTVIEKSAYDTLLTHAEKLAAALERIPHDKDCDFIISTMRKRCNCPKRHLEDWRKFREGK